MSVQTTWSASVSTIRNTTIRLASKVTADDEERKITVMEEEVAKLIRDANLNYKKEMTKKRIAKKEELNSIQARAFSETIWKSDQMRKS